MASCTTCFRALTLVSCVALLLALGGCSDDDGGTPQVDAGADAGAGGADAGDGPVSCAGYCAAVMSACTGANSQYPDVTACVNHCSAVAGWQAGSRGTPSGNTIGCRHYHAQIAAGLTGSAPDPVTHCPHAGPTGGNVCGTWCDNYCGLSARNCIGDNSLGYADEAACQTTCAAFPQNGATTATGGNSVQCRIYHLGAPAAGDPETHCPHGTTGGGGVCTAPGS